MKTVALLAFLAVISLSLALDFPVAVAQVRGTTNDPTIIGTVTFTAAAGNLVTMTVNVSGITVNTAIQHGIHIHEFGDITYGNGTSVGGHWNSLSQPHGCPPSTTRHIGDTGNWDVLSDGTIFQSKDLDLISLTGTNSLVGLAVIVHATTDDCTATLSAAARLAHGVIGIANPTYHGATNNSAASGPSYGSVTSAICNFQLAAGGNSSGNTATGWVKFTQATPTSTTYVSGMVTGLPANTVHGFHVHQWGDLTTQDGNSAGPHYTGPILDASVPHAIPGSGLTMHVGDMGNLFYTNGGVHYFRAETTEFGLWGHPNSVIGRAVIIHDMPDDCSQPYGNAGKRAYICVIGAANPNVGGAQALPSGITVPTAQDTSSCPSATTSAEEPSSFSTILVPSFIVAMIAAMFF